MNTIRPCGCKGIRSCLECEKLFTIKKPSSFEQLKRLEAWSFCPACSCLYEGWDTSSVIAGHPKHGDSKAIKFPGVEVHTNFLSDNEGKTLLKQLDDEIPWMISQSGRRKQNFGPKTNFKKKKLNNSSFNGFPKFTQYIQQRFNSIHVLHDFQSIEQCTLEYDPQKGASIDAHIDDCWIWGERVVTVNCLGDSVLTLTLMENCEEPTTKYNLDLVQTYSDKLIEPLIQAEKLKQYKDKVIRIPMPNYSLIILYGPPRYQFEHAVLREDIQERRVCIAYREFTPLYLSDGEFESQGSAVIENAQRFT